MITEADKIKDEYFRLRAKALVALAEKFGKRRSEIASLTRKDLKIEDRLLLVTFTLHKKHKKGLFQYIKHLEKLIRKGMMNRSDLDAKTHMQLDMEWREWTATEEGHSIRQDKRTKSVDLSDRYAKLIVEYMNFLDSKYPNAKFLFPSGLKFFGSARAMAYDRNFQQSNFVGGGGFGNASDSYTGDANVTFWFRHDITWQDGVPFTVDDFNYTML